MNYRLANDSDLDQLAEMRWLHETEDCLTLIKCSL